MTGPSDNQAGQPLPPPIFDPPVADEVADELEFHVEMRVRELVAAGMDPESARRQALARFDDITRVTSELHHLARQRDDSVRRTRFFANFAQDIHFAFRMMRRRRAFAMLAILTIGLGIGAATAIYSVVDGVMLRPLPFPDSHRIVAVWMSETSFRDTPTLATWWDKVPLGQEEYDALRERATTLRGVALWANGGAMLEGPGGVEPVSTLLATSTLLPMLGLKPVLGRGFQAGEDAAGGPHIAMVSWEAWQSRFAGDSGLVGKSILLDTTRYTVVGILPPSLRIDRNAPPAPIWTPALQRPDDEPSRHNRNYRALARLAPGATATQASSQVAQIARDLKIAWKGKDGGTSGRVSVLQEDQTRDVRASLWILAAAVALLLLVACVNVATMMLGEAARREPEIAARMALGAAPSRLARQLLTECITIATLGALVGGALAWFGTRSLVAIAPPGIPGLADVRLDWRVLLFAATCSLLTGVAFGLAPAFALLKFGRHSSVRVGTGQTARGSTGLQRGLVAAEVGLSLILLVGCSLLGRSLVRLSAVNAGFQPNGLLEVRLTLPSTMYRDDQRLERFFAEMARDLKTVPGVTGVTGTSTAPFSSIRNGSTSPIKVEGKEYADGDYGTQTQQLTVMLDYFHVMQIPVLAGRDFAADDAAGGAPVAILSESSIKRDWGGESPLGRRVFWQGQWRTVIGIAGDVRNGQLSRNVEPTIYTPLAQRMTGLQAILVRSRGDAAQLTTTIRQRIKAIDPAVVVSQVDPLPNLIQRSYGEERYRALLGSLFGVLAAMLCAVGMFGVISRSVARRMREAGIRVALGAPAGRLTRLMMRETLIGAGIGALIGIPVALLLGSRLQPYLFGVTSHDPVAIGVALVLIGAATLLATLPAARRAARVDPTIVMRAE